MNLRPGYSWSATTSGTRDGSGVPSRSGRVRSESLIADTALAVSGPPHPICAPLWKPNRSTAERIRGGFP